MTSELCPKCEQHQSRISGQICDYCAAAKEQCPLKLLEWAIDDVRPRDDGTLENLLRVREEFIRLKKKAGE